MTTATQGKVAKLNVVVASVREWQRGAISAGECESRLGMCLTAAEIVSFWPVVRRTTDERSLAQLIARALAL